MDGKLQMTGSLHVLVLPAEAAVPFECMRDANEILEGPRPLRTYFA